MNCETQQTQRSYACTRTGARTSVETPAILRQHKSDLGNWGGSSASLDHKWPAVGQDFVLMAALGGKLPLDGARPEGIHERLCLLTLHLGNVFLT